MATVVELKEKATDLGLEFKEKATKPELEALIAEAENKAPENVESTETNEGAENEATQTLGENEQNDEQKQTERLEALKDMAKELDLEFDEDISVSDLEALIQVVLDKTKADQEAKAKEEAEAKAKADQEAKDAEPKINKDGFEAGKQLSPDEFAKYMAKQRAKK